MTTDEIKATANRLRAVANQLETGEVIELNLTIGPSTAPTSTVREGKVVAVNLRASYIGRLV